MNPEFRCQYPISCITIMGRETLPLPWIFRGAAVLSRLLFTTIFFAIAALAGADTLPLIMKESAIPNYGKTAPAWINGHVAISAPGGVRRGVPGVSVSDGYSVVQTDGAGRYQIAPNKDAVFIFITRPTGYDLRGPWYHALAPRVDFSLSPATEDENEFTFIHVTDTHINATLRSKERLSDFVREINALVPKPRFVINSGDLIDLHKALKSSPQQGLADMNNYVGIMNNLEMPYYNVAGDHSDSSYRLADFPLGDHRAGKALYWEHLGPNFYSFEYGNFHFTSVDTSYHLGQRQINGDEYPTLEVQPMHVAWMGQDMKNRSGGTSVITMSESDLSEQCPQFLELAREGDVRLQMTGDTHVVSEGQGEIPYRTAGALAGCWWNDKCKQLCPDLSPQGYLIYRASGSNLETFYKGLWHRVAITSHRVGAPWRDKILLEAHIVQPRAGERLQWSLDGDRWYDMVEKGRPFYRAVFEQEIDTFHLRDGLVKIHVRSSLTGETRTSEFVVCNGTAPSGSGGDTVLSLSTQPFVQRPGTPPTESVNVLFNGAIVGQIDGSRSQEYTFSIPDHLMQRANRVTFGFSARDDGMLISSPILSSSGVHHFDIRDVAIRAVREAHWGDKAIAWGGFAVGERNLDETPFIRKQNEFCFVTDALPQVASR